MKIYLYFTFFTFIAFYSCKNVSKPSKELIGDTIKNKYSSGFCILKNDSGYLLKVYNPWQKAQNVSFSYVLGSSLPEKTNDNEIFIQTPVRKVICMSTTHIAYIDVLEENISIKGVSGSSFINNKLLQKEITAGNVFDVGYEQNLNFELIASIHPDVVFAYSVGAELSGVITKLKTLNIPVVVVAEYLESDPLAKAEWIKFFSVFYNKYPQASAYFDSIEKQYLETKKLALKAASKPLVMSGLPWNGTWYISGGETYTGKLIADANGDYIWKNELSRESIPMDYELVFQKSANADIWINLSSAGTISDVLQVDSRIKAIKALRNKTLYNNNAISNISGGNDFWESGTVQPHIILKDLVKIFHPDLIPQHQLVYYKKLD